MLLLTKKIHADAIRNGSKTFEIRCGARYRNIRPGHFLSINGHFRVEVTRVQTHASQEILCEAMPGLNAAIQDCYGDKPGPYFVFHFNPPVAPSLH